MLQFRDRFCVFLSTFTIFVGLAACHPFQGIPIDSTYASKIKTVSISVIIENKSVLSEPQGGLESLLTGQPYKNVDDLDTAFQKLDFHLEKQVADALAAELATKGINTVSTSTIEPIDGTLLIDIYTAKYARDIGQSDYKPFAILNAKLTDATGTVVYKHQFFYDPRNLSDSDVVFFPVDIKYYFSSKDALLANPKLAAEGLSAFSQPLAKVIAQQIAP